MKYILAIDQGTTSSRTLLFDQEGVLKNQAQQEISQITPHPNWVEQDPREIWETQQRTLQKVLQETHLSAREIAAIGIANQRETTLIWNRKTGHPIYNAIVWQDQRTTDRCAQLKTDGIEPLIYQKTGLNLNPYFSATKIEWILDHVDGARAQAERGELAFGTIDTWLLWNLTGQHATDLSNASRTLLLNLHTQKWDPELLALFNIPAALLPTLKSSSEIYGTTHDNIPIAGIAGDQQAALFGQKCFNKGNTKNTYGTGCFMLMNTGSTPIPSKNKLLTTLAWKQNNQTTYALEGSVFMGGAIVQWLRDQLNIIQHASDIETLAAQVPNTQGVYLVPAFTGLGAPHWDPLARGILTGLTQRTSKAHIARAALEAMCFQSIDVLQAMENDTQHPIKTLRVDGGASANNLLMQLQADLLQRPVIRPQQIETTAFGAAALAGLAVGYWKNLPELKTNHHTNTHFEPQISADEAAQRHKEWNHAINQCKT